MTRIRADLVRGGTSRGVFVHLDDLPTDVDTRDRLLVDLLGSPDPLQVDGLGGGASSTSKVVAVRAAQDPEADIEYMFYQVGINERIVDTSGNCGNLSYAVGPWAVEQGLLRGPNSTPERIRLRNLNTGRLLVSTTRPGTGAGPYQTGTAVDIDHIDPAGQDGANVFPTGAAYEYRRWRHGLLPVTIAGIASVVIMIPAGELGLTATESRDELSSRTDLLADLEELRAQVAAELGIGGARGPSRAVPRIAILAAAQLPERDLESRSISLQRAHHAIPGTSAICVAAAARLAGTVPHKIIGAPATPDAATVRIGHPRGQVEIRVETELLEGRQHVTSAGTSSTARTLMTGIAMVPQREDRT
ncbi:hypothetical protein EV191_102462 [Tamaricihabitans halophyticus]|uniref:2-methylaconitate cis-trans isomerase n=1 Tax=Tamaricihabitans halophyticus TaxID=1262583 RepID=A0A4R2QYD8_9PSEU|nr:PrpF domain-containing protein [Tamaricihabitans halophyticus]TCP55250.1 hypothetical protein EV191_102462 [Tamaricihabitans halophyticus]